MAHRHQRGRPLPHRRPGRRGTSACSWPRTPPVGRRRSRCSRRRPRAVVASINARIADGRDPSWLWDVPYERLRGRFVVATGERRHDLAVRLLYAGVEHEVAESLDKAVQLAGRATGQTEIDLIANYTAFQDYLDLVGPRAGRPAMSDSTVRIAPAVPRAARHLRRRRQQPGARRAAAVARPRRRGRRRRLGRRHPRVVRPVPARRRRRRSPDRGRPRHRHRRAGPSSYPTPAAVVFAVCAGAQIAGRIVPRVRRRAGRRHRTARLPRRSATASREPSASCSPTPTDVRPATAHRLREPRQPHPARSDGDGARHRDGRRRQRRRHRRGAQRVRPGQGRRHLPARTGPRPQPGPRRPVAVVDRRVPSSRSTITRSTPCAPSGCKAVERGHLDGVARRTWRDHLLRRS